MLGSDKEFVITEAQTPGPGHGTAYQCSELSGIPLSYPGAMLITIVECLKDWPLKIRLAH